MRSKRHLNTQEKYFFGISNWFLKPEKKRLVGILDASGMSLNDLFATSYAIPKHNSRREGILCK